MNQIMIQRVQDARNEYDARMGIIFTGWIKVFLPPYHCPARHGFIRTACKDFPGAVGGGQT